MDISRLEVFFSKGFNVRLPVHKKTVWINEKYMTDLEKQENPTWESTGGYLKIIEATNEDKQKWWDNLDDEEREEVMSLPNFDKEIFKKITGIEV